MLDWEYHNFPFIILILFFPRVIHLFPWYGIIDDNQQLSDTFRVPDLKTGKMVRLITQFSAKEEEMFRNMVRRVNTVISVSIYNRLFIDWLRLCTTLIHWGCVTFQAAKELDVRVMIDAEQTYFQPAISRITLEMMRKYNKEKAIVFNTYQCYLRDTYNEVTTDLEQAKRQNFYFGAKLVRGAYLEQVTERRKCQRIFHVLLLFKLWCNTVISLDLVEDFPN